MKTGVFKFKYGEEIITEYEDRGDYFYIVNAGGLLPTEEGGYHLMVWMPYSTVKHGFLLPKSEVWFVGTLAPEMEEYYSKWKKAILTNLKIPNSEKTN